MWSKKYKECLMCKKTIREHRGKGFCTSCYTTNRYNTEEEYKKTHTKIVKKWYLKNRKSRLAQMEKYNYLVKIGEVIPRKRLTKTKI